MSSVSLDKNNWNTRYLGSMLIIAAAWWLVYLHIEPVSISIVQAMGLDTQKHFGASLQFFLYDTVKILMLLVSLIYILACVRASLNVERVRDYLAGKRRGFGYFLGSVFGSITPFCSCSSIPLFLGFTMARIPVGITMSFLITSPLINEIAIVLLWGLLGWKFTVVYVLVGMSAGILGGFFMDSIKAERWLQPFVREAAENAPEHVAQTHSEDKKLTLKERHDFAYQETATIFKRVWKWVIIGVGIGAGLHGFVPENWFAENLGAGEWWSVPASVLVGIPLYSSVTGIIPVMESLLMKGLPIGTTLAFCMSSVAASIPELVLLRQIMTWKLQAAFLCYLWIMFTLVGLLLNNISSYIITS